MKVPGWITKRVGELQQQFQLQHYDITVKMYRFPLNKDGSQTLGNTTLDPKYHQAVIWFQKGIKPEQCVVEHEMMHIVLAELDHTVREKIVHSFVPKKMQAYLIRLFNHQQEQVIEMLARGLACDTEV